MNMRNNPNWISVKGITAIISEIDISAKHRDLAIELIMAKKQNGHNTKIDNVRISTMTALVSLFEKNDLCENPGAGAIDLRKKWLAANRPHFIVNTDLLYPEIRGGNLQARLMSTLRANAEYLNVHKSQIQVYRETADDINFSVIPSTVK